MARESRRLVWFLVTAAFLTLIPTLSHAQTNLALGRPAVAASLETASFPASAAVDGNATTRWSSAYTDPQWIYVDLGSARAVTRVVLRWEAAYGKAYQIQTSNDAVGWTSIYSTTTSDGGVDDLTVNGNGRYVRMYGTARATAWGYSLFELEVYGTTSATATATARATPTATATTPRATATATSGSATNIALNKAAVASSLENAANGANLAVDGNTGTRWSSAFSDPQWIRVDLGAVATIARIRLNWEAAYGKSYQLQVSSDAVTWANVVSTTTSDGGLDDYTVSTSGRYVRMYGTVRGTAWGYSLWEFEVYGAGGGPTATATPTTGRATATATATRTSTPTATAQATSDGRNWKGYTWNISNGAMAGVIPANPANVFVDASGFLHLRIVGSGGSYTGAETFTTGLLGFGTYQWQLQGPLDNMDKAVVLGLFPYGPAAGIGVGGENEIDIELSKWNNTCGCNADFAFWPSTGHANLGNASDLFTINLAGGNLLTARFVWRSTSIVGTIMSGLQPVGTTANVLRSFTFAPSDFANRIPQQALPLGMNLWSYQVPPTSNQEVIVRDFQYVP